MNKLQVIQNMLDEQTRRLHHLLDKMTVIEDELEEARYLLQQTIIEQEDQKNKNEDGHDYIRCYWKD